MCGSRVGWVSPVLYSKMRCTDSVYPTRLSRQPLQRQLCPASHVGVRAARRCRLERWPRTRAQSLEDEAHRLVARALAQAQHGDLGDALVAEDVLVGARRLLQLLDRVRAPQP